MVFNCRVRIGDYLFTSVAELSTESTWRKFTDTAKIKIPKAVYFKEGDKWKPVKNIKTHIKTGDPVSIECGYDTQYVTDFVGYVARSPRPTIPYEIECEDEMWQLKRKQVSVNLRNAKVKEIIEAAAPSYEVECVDEVYGAFSLKNVTPVEVFAELKKRAGLYTFFRGKKLVCGLMYSDPNISTIRPLFKFGENIISSTLQYVDPVDVRIKVYGTSVQPDGSVIRAEVGDDGGDIVRWPESNKSELELKRTIQRIHDQYKTRGGYDGNLTSFGFPSVSHGQTVHIADNNLYEQRDSYNLVESVKTRVSVSDGYRRIIEIGGNA